MKFNVGVTRCAKAIDCLLMHTFNQQKFNLVFSSDTLAISPSCFVLTDVVLNESSSQQHIKKKLSRQYERLRRRPEEMSSRGKSQDKTPEREEMVACKSEWLHKCDRSHQIAPGEKIFAREPVGSCGQTILRWSSRRRQYQSAPRRRHGWRTAPR